MDVVLVHGYNVTSTNTYGVLPQRLKSAGHNVKDVYISKYVTLDDDIRLSDIVRAFDAALRDVYKSSFGKTKFACVTHSTGALVARDWIHTNYASSMAGMPMSHLIMLAPPNNGSRLAELGKSRLSRLRSLIGVEPGIKVLDSLELASQYQWDLNSSWMRKKLHATPGFYPVVIAGQWIDRHVWDVIVPATYERGSDGVVRAASANLNMQKISIEPGGRVLREVMGGIPFLITPKTSHSDERGIVGSIPTKGDHPVLNAILATLDVDNREAYNELEAEFAMNTTVLQRKDTYHDGSKLDRYCQVVFRMSDQMGNVVGDYAIELIDGSLRGDRLPSGFFGDRHKNLVNPEFFVYYLDYNRISDVKGGKLGFRVQSIPNTPLIAYEDCVFTAPLDVDTLIKPNQTTFVDVVLKRRINKSVFQLTKDFSYQKITGKPGEDWIE